MSSPAREAVPRDLAAADALADLADAVIVIDETQRLVVFNRAASELFGYPADELLGEPLDILLPAGLGERHRDLVAEFGAGPIFRRAMSGRKTLVGRRSDGTDFPIDITIGKTRLGDRVLFNAVIRDATEQRREEGALAATIDRFAALSQHASDGVLVTDTKGHILYASPLLWTLSGLTDDDVTDVTVFDLLHPADYEANLAAISSLVKTPGMSIDFEARCRGVEGRWLWAEVTTTNMVDDPRVGGFVINFRDISERRTADAQREAVASLGRRALSGVSFSQLAHDAAGMVTELLDATSAAILEQIADEPESLLVRACVGWSSDSVGARIPAPADSPGGRTLQDTKPTIINDYATAPEFPTKKLVDAAGLRSSLVVAISGDNGPWGVIGVLSERPDRFTETDADFVEAVANVLASALEHDRSQAEILYQALHDPLTGLPNRVLLNDRVKGALADARQSLDHRLVIHTIDLDGFKQFNDTFGHQAGDEVLVQVAQRLGETIQTQGTVARSAGDKFVVVTHPGPRAPNLGTSADQILETLRRPYQVEGSELRLTASVGVVISTDADDTAEQLFHDADAAMDTAKSRGRNRSVIFDDDVRIQLAARNELERDLRLALERDELRIHYQPVVDCTRGETIGLEALVRWEHPQRGLIGPAEFIPAAEATGLILPIGRWVLEQACQQLTRWQRDHHRPELAVSVNLSPRQLTDPHLLGVIGELLATTGIKPSSLRLEITEDMIVEDFTNATGTLESITELGVGLIIDDFGTGYSALAYIKRLPVICIKIDQAFIADICTNQADQAIVSAINDITAKLDICSVVEGVETAAQLAAVRELGCTLIQGYYYARPLPAADADAWLARPALPPTSDHQPEPTSPIRAGSTKV